jgi:peptide/nickel transport system ATP-binding protein
MSFLSVRDLTIAARGGKILDTISFDLERGRVLGLIGESGAGKSTLALASMGFLKPGLSVTSGSVVLDGADFVTMDDTALRKLRRDRMAYVAQSAAAAFNPFYRLGAQVTELRSARGDRYALAAELFGKLRLPEPETFARKYPHQVSGGQLQRAMIAMALINDPDLIVFDEPTTALDVTTQLEVLRVIREVIAAQGCAAIYVSHDLAVVSQMCDDILVLRHGRMVERNTARGIIDAPTEDYTRALVAHRAAGDFVSTGGAPPVLLEARGLKLGYGRVDIVPKADLTVGKGEVVALVGESGSGKTTLARALAGLLETREGSVTLNGVPLHPSIDRRDSDQMRRIQFVHQLPDVAMNPRQRIRTILARPLALFGGLRGTALNNRLASLMREVELSETLLDRVPGALSGGQKQRVCIARCLAAEPDLLICDEVTSALDPLVEDSILKLLWRLKESHRMGIVFITHNLSVTRRFANRVLIMERGKIVETGPTEAVFSAPQQDYTRTLLAANPEMRGGWLDERMKG